MRGSSPRMTESVNARIIHKIKLSKISLFLNPGRQRAKAEIHLISSFVEQIYSSLRGSDGYRLLFLGPFPYLSAHGPSPERRDKR